MVINTSKQSLLVTALFCNNLGQFVYRLVSHVSAMLLVLLVVYYYCDY